MAVVKNDGGPSTDAATRRLLELEPGAWAGPGLHPAPIASIIVLVLGDTSRVVPCLDSVARNTGLPHEVILVANGTAAEKLQPLRGRENLIVIPSHANLGFGGGCNRGAAVARAEFLVLLNDDTEVEAGWLDSLVTTAREIPEAAAVGARILFPDGRLQEAGTVIWSDATTTQAGRGLAADSGAYDRVRDVDYCSGACLLIRRDAWERAGGMDPAYFPAYYEDADLCMRLRAAGHRVLFDPDARVRHAESASSSLNWRTFLATRNAKTFRSRWGAELRTHGVHPATPAAVRAAVDAEVARAQRRPPVTSKPAPVPPAAPPATGKEREQQLLEMELAAARRELQLKDEFIAELTRDQAALQRLRRVMRFLPVSESFIRRTGRWLRRP